MTTYRSLNHTKWHCQYHVVFIPKYRRKAMYGGLRQELGEVFRRLAAHRESEVEEGHLLPDHVHMMMSIPPKYSVAQVIGYLKGKSAIHIAREFAGRSRNFRSSRRWGAMSGLSESTSSSRNARIGGGISCRWIRACAQVTA